MPDGFPRRLVIMPEQGQVEPDFLRPLYIRRSGFTGESDNDDCTETLQYAPL